MDERPLPFLAVKLGALLFSQATTWREFADAARRADRLGYDHFWTWDHLYPIFGDPYQPIFEGWTAIAALAGMTERVRLGLMVGANTFRNPGIVAKMAATIDHASGGRAILGLGAAWFELEHSAHGIDFGRSAGERLGWLDEAVGVVRKLLDGEEVTHRSKRYAFDRARHAPRPLQRRLPIMIGGSGEQKTLRTVARYADMWNMGAEVEDPGRKVAALERHCADVGREVAAVERTVIFRPVLRDDPGEAERVWQAQMAHNKVKEAVLHWAGPPDDIATRLRAYQPFGFETFIAELPAPFDAETIERLATEVRPMVEGRRA